LPKSKPLQVILNKDIVDGKQFTQLNANVFDYLEHIGENGFRLVFYYKSHINLNDAERDRSFCFVGYDTLKERLKVGSATIKDANEQLRKNKLVKIEKHQLGHDYEYNEDDELSFSRWNNHYKIRDTIL
jgi:hypothetical protein